MIAFINDGFVDQREAKLHVADLAIQRGYAVFDFFRTKDFKPLFLDDYLDRFFHSISLLHLNAPVSKEELASVIHEVVAKNNMPEAGIKLMLTGGYSDDGFVPGRPNLLVTQHPIQLTTNSRFNEGIGVITHEYQRDLPSTKSINYLVGVWLQDRLKQTGAADVLYHQEGNISEFPRSNVFIVTKDGSIVTPADNILHGITRKKVIELATGSYPVETRNVHLEELMDAAEVFMTSTTKRILPVNKVNGVMIGKGKSGPVSTALNEAFIKMEDAYIASLASASVSRP